MPIEEYNLNPIDYIHPAVTTRHFEEILTQWQMQSSQRLCLDTIERKLCDFYQESNLTMGQFLRGLDILQHYVLIEWQRVADHALYPWLVLLQKTMRSYLSQQLVKTLIDFRQDLLTELQYWREMLIVNETLAPLSDRIEKLLNRLSVYEPYLEKTVYRKVQTYLQQLSRAEINDEITAIIQIEQSLKTLLQLAEWQQMFQLNWTRIKQYAQLPWNNFFYSGWQLLNAWRISFRSLMSGINFLQQVRSSAWGVDFLMIHNSIRNASKTPIITMSYLLMSQTIVNAMTLSNVKNAALAYKEIGTNEMALSDASSLNVRAINSSDTFLITLGSDLRSDSASSIQVLPNGDFVITGYSALSTTGIIADLLLAKFSKKGDLVWANLLGGYNSDFAAGSDYGESIQVLANGELMIVGYTESFNLGAGNFDMLMIKQSAEGDLTWAKALGGNGTDIGHSTQKLPGGELMIVGFTNSFGAGDRDVLMVKLSPAGDIILARTFGSNRHEDARAIQLLSDGGLVITGYAEGIEENDGGVLVAKLSAAGDPIWVKSLGGSKNEYGNAIQELPNGDLIVFGYTTGFEAMGADALLVRLNAEGQLIWAKRLGGNDNEYGYSIRVIPSDGGFVISGRTENFETHNSAPFLAKIDTNGDLIWVKGFESGQFKNSINSIQVLPNGEIVAAGATDRFEMDSVNVLLARLNAFGEIDECNDVLPIDNFTITSITPNVSTLSISSLTLNMTTVDYTDQVYQQVIGTGWWNSLCPSPILVSNTNSSETSEIASPLSLLGNDVIIGLSITGSVGTLLGIILLAFFLYSKRKRPRSLEELPVSKKEFQQWLASHSDTQSLSPDSTALFQLTVEQQQRLSHLLEQAPSLEERCNEANVLQRDGLSYTSATKSDKTQKNREKYYLEQQPVLEDYYKTFRRVLNQTFVAAFAVSSHCHLVKRNHEGFAFNVVEKGADVIADGIALVCDEFPGIRTAGKILTALIHKGQDIHTNKQLARLVSIATGPAEMEKLIEQVARQLAIGLRESLFSVTEKTCFPLFDKIKYYYEKMKKPFQIELVDTPQKKQAMEDALKLLEGIIQGKPSSLLTSKDFVGESVNYVVGTDRKMQKLTEEELKLSKVSISMAIQTGASSSSGIEQRVSYLETLTQQLAEEREEREVELQKQKQKSIEFDQYRIIIKGLEERLSEQTTHIQQINQQLQGQENKADQATVHVLTQQMQGLQELHQDIQLQQKWLRAKQQTLDHQVNQIPTGLFAEVGEMQMSTLDFLEPNKKLQAFKFQVTQMQQQIDILLQTCAEQAEYINLLSV